MTNQNITMQPPFNEWWFSGDVLHGADPFSGEPLIVYAGPRTKHPEEAFIMDSREPTRRPIQKLPTYP